jgi:hypothetical protein
MVQEPADALFTGMPDHALESLAVDYRLTVDDAPGRKARPPGRRAPAGCTVGGDQRSGRIGV